MPGRKLIVCAAARPGTRIEAAPRADHGNANARPVVLNSFREQGLRGDPFPFRAVVECARADADPMSIATALSGVNLAGSRSFVAEQHVVREGRAAVKLVILSRRKSGLSVAEYHRHWLEVHGPLVMSQPGFSARLRGYVQFHIAEGSWQGLSQRLPEAEEPYDGMMQMWFDSADDMLAAFSGDAYKTVIRSDEPAFVAQGRSTSFLARETSGILYTEDSSDRRI